MVHPVDGVVEGRPHVHARRVGADDVEQARRAEHRVAGEGVEADGDAELFARPPEGVVRVMPPLDLGVGQRVAQEDGPEVMLLVAAPHLVACGLDVVDRDDVRRPEHPLRVLRAPLRQPVVQGAVDRDVVLGIGDPGERAGGVHDRGVDTLVVHDAEAGRRLDGPGRQRAVHALLPLRAVGLAAPAHRQQALLMLFALSGEDDVAEVEAALADPVAPAPVLRPVVLDDAVRRHVAVLGLDVGPQVLRLHVMPVGVDHLELDLGFRRHGRSSPAARASKPGAERPYYSGYGHGLEPARAAGRP